MLKIEHLTKRYGDKTAADINRLIRNRKRNG